MKKTIAFLLMLLLLFSCSACGKDDQRNEGSGDSETEQQQPQDDDVQSEDSTDAPGKIVLDGTPVRWDEFPMPTAETFGLTGEDAIIYNAIAQVYNPKVYADTFSQSPEDVTDLSLPAFEIYEKSKSENGNTIYYGVFYECVYYNLGSDLADLNNPVYSLVKGKSPANLTIDTQGNFVDFEQTPESSNDPYGDIRRVCGPMTELADFLCGETETYSKEPLKVPDLNAEAMVINISIIISAKANLRVALFPQINSGEEGYFPILPPDGTDFCCRSKITSAAGCRSSLRGKVDTEKINLSHSK